MRLRALLALAVLLACHWLPSPLHAVEGRLLLQDCPPGCDACTSDPDSGAVICTKCTGKLVLDLAHGTCQCMGGTYADAENTCSDCPKGSWCGGGTYQGVAVPDKTDCPERMTTLGRRTTSIKACVNLPGTYFTQTDGVPSAITCAPDKFGPGLRKQRACVPCPNFMTTNGATGQASISGCLVMEGYYLKAAGQAAPCPTGQWKAGLGSPPACTRCAGGVTTALTASTSEAACTIVAAGYYPAVVTDGIVKSVEACPQKFYCAGGPATSAFDPSNPQPSSETNTVAQCPDGTWTQSTGAKNALQCLTPPGFKTTDGQTVPCVNGEYRSGWARPDTAGSCDRCGDGVQSEATEEILEFNAASGAPRSVAVRSDVEACFILPGQGLSYNPITDSWKARNCDNNNYGVPSIMYGRIPMGCRDCPTGMITSLSLENSAQYFVSDKASPPHQGFTDPMACVTPGGYGYDGTSAQPCPAGSFNAAGGYSACMPCPLGMSTPSRPSAQVSQDNCTIAKGFGYVGGSIQPCPIGMYNDALQSNLTTPCTPCPQHTTTPNDGAVSARDCTLCVGGWAESGCNTQCGGAHGADYSPPGQEKGSKCVQCPLVGAGFFFDYKGTPQDFSPAIIARPAADSLSSCLAEFAQVGDMAWFMGGSASLQVVPDAANFTACVAACQADSNCQYITYDYNAAAGKCAKKVQGSGSDIIAFKATFAGDAAGSSVQARMRRQELVRAQLAASGAYTYWRDDATGMGADQNTVVAAATTNACTARCDDDLLCAGVVMTGISPASTTPTSCRLIKGDGRLAMWKRSMTRVVLERLSLAAVLA